MKSSHSRPSDGQILAAFNDMLIRHKRAEQAHDVFDALREAKTLSPHTPQNWVALFAPTYSGKSRSVKLYMERVIDDAVVSGRFPTTMDRVDVGKAQTRVIDLSLPSSNITQKTLITMLLARLGDPLPNKGNTGEQLQRAYDLMRKLGTELLFIDEMQHLSAAMREGARSHSADSARIPYLIKTLLDNGHVPIVCIGVSEGKAHLMRNGELKNRCYQDLDFSPIKADSAEMIDVFVTYCGRLSYKLVDYGIFPEVSDFISGEIPDCFLDVSSGKLGDATMFIRSACYLAVRRGASRVEYQDLEAANDESIKNGDTKVNFFRRRREENERKGRGVVEG